MKETVDTILYNSQTHQAQRVEATIESIQRVFSLGGVSHAMEHGVSIELARQTKSIVFNDVLVPLYPTVQEQQNIKN